MRSRIFLVTLTGCIFILLCAFFMTSSGMQKINGIHLDTLSGRLYQEDTNIMLKTMKAMDVSKLESISLPSSWGEIMLVDNQSLRIKASTIPGHKGIYMYKIRELLDQAGPILKAISQGKPSIARTRSYMVAVVPSGNAATLVGLKPKTWEKALLLAQKNYLGKVKRNAEHATVITLVVGGILAFIFSLFAALSATRSIKRMISCLDALSKGDLDSPYPVPRTLEERILASSMERIKASLSIALEKLGVR